MAGQVRVERRTAVTFYGPITLGELRGFVRELDGTPDEARVQVTHYPGNQRDGSSTTITVHGVGA